MTARGSADIVVIGAGPAGIGAALEAASTGAEVHVIDGFGRPGGQYWMQPPPGPMAQLHQVREGAAQIDALLGAGVTLHAGTEVWSVLPGWRVLARRADGESLDLSARALIVCSGAHDRVVPFPGWTLPGVMTAGGGQRFAKLAGRAPGARVVVAGTGVFLWAVAASVLKAGGKLVAVAEARRDRLGLLRLLAGFPERWPEALRLAAPLLRARVPLLLGHAVSAAEGEERLRAVRLAELRAGAPAGSAGAETRLEADALLVGHGFRPQIEITALLGCAHAYEAGRGGWHCVADPQSGRTSLEGVFAAGEVTGVAGARPALLRGRLAGLAACEGMGLGPAGLARRRRALTRALGRAQAFADGLSRLFPAPSELASMVRPETIVCRCEEVTWQDLRSALDDGADSLYGAKLWTRAGMGRCQGRLCGDAIAALASRALGRDPAALGFNAPRFPLRPVPLELVAETLSEEPD